MNRVLRPSTAFMRAARRLVKSRPELAIPLQETLRLLEEDAFHPRLRTHKLKGELQANWSCSVTRDVRIVFEFMKAAEAELIYLHGVGGHDAVY